MFPDGGSPPRKQNFWASLGTNFGMDVGRDLVGRRHAGTPGVLDTLGLGATYSVLRHKATLSIHQLRPHLGDSHMPIFWEVYNFAHSRWDINTMLGVSNQSCVHEKLWGAPGHSDISAGGV